MLARRPPGVSRGRARGEIPQEWTRGELQGGHRFRVWTPLPRAFGFGGRNGCPLPRESRGVGGSWR